MTDITKEIDQLIQQGAVKMARDRLLPLREQSVRQGIKETELVAFANLARRAGLADLGVLLLNPLVRPRKRVRTPAPSEVAEYAACLYQIGVHREASELLKTLNPQEIPQALLFQAFLLFAKWDYESSIPLLEKYISLQDVNAYSYCVGLVNLVDAYESVEHPNFEKELKHTLDLTAQRNHVFLHGVLTKIAARAAVWRNDYKNADLWLEKSWRLLKDVNTLDGLFVKKWRAILQLRQNGASGEIQETFKSLAVEAVQFRHWETLRELDLHWGLQTSDENLLKKVFAGTPHPSYRQRIQKLYPQIKVEQFSWNISGHENALEWDIRSFYPQKLKPGQIMDRLLKLFMSDFYSPFRVSQIHDALYANQYWNPHSSPDRVHQVIFRLRAWLKQQKIPLEIAEQNEALFFKSKKPLRLLVQSDENRTGDPTLIRLLELVGPDFIHCNTSVIAQKLGISRRSAQRLKRCQAP